MYTHNCLVLFCCIDTMDTKKSNDSAKKIQRYTGMSDLHSHQPPLEICANEVKSEETESLCAS